MIISRWRVWCETEGCWKDWYLPDSQGEPTTCPTDSAHTITPLKTAKMAQDVSEVGRQSPDGALIVKQDPGTSTTDPRFRPHTWEVPQGAGSHWHDLDVPSDGTSRMQYLTVQVQSPVFGDRVEVYFRSTGVPGMPPVDTVLGIFGGITPAMECDSAGWGGVRREPQDQGSAKLVPAGVKVSLLYVAVDATQHRVCCDVCCHE